MISFLTADIFSIKADALVNPVNTEGIMGKGLALQVKRRFPDVFLSYQMACSRGELAPGTVQVCPRFGRPKYVINFPTKTSWRLPSRLEYVRDGLVDLVKQVQAECISSIAIPALGCGAGGLRWKDVRPLIEAAFEPLADVHAKLVCAGSDLNLL